MDETKETETGKQRGWKSFYRYRGLVLINALFFCLLIVTFVTFYHSYSSLTNSIQKERIESVRQVTDLISKRVGDVRSAYASETEQAARIVEHAGAADLASLMQYLPDENAFLVDEEGKFVMLDGSVLVINDTELMDHLLSGTDVNTTFSTIQTRGDYWLFSVPLKDTVIGGRKYIGFVTMVDAQRYADLFTITLYDHRGESLVVSADGTIKMKPSGAAEISTFNGYNLLRILDKSDISQNDKDAFAEALRLHKNYSVFCRMDDVTWMIQSGPMESSRNIVVVVPVSLTAKTTFNGMRNSMIRAILFIATLSAAFIFNLIHIFRRNQLIETEHAKAKSKSDFLDKMSHDIRTPLNAIVGMHELALQSLDDREMVRDCLIKARASSRYLVSIINDVLDMSRIEKGKLTINPERLDMKELLEHIIQIESQSAKDKQITLKLAADSDFRTDYLGDPVRIRQMLMNLVNNSIKFTPEHGSVTLRYHEQPSEGNTVQASFIVEDSGIGMSEEFLAKLFHPFEQEHNTLTSTFAGSGLGLSIVHELVSLMGGTISVTSKKGAGSRFLITLPLTVLIKDPASGVRTEIPQDDSRLAGKRILLAEDNAINRQIISALLERMGLQVDEAENGQIAVDRLTGSSPGTYALILMDIMMPVMGGLDAARMIRASGHPDSGTIPIIALSANAFEEDAQKSREAGMQMHLAKPIDIDALKQAIKTYIR